MRSVSWVRWLIMFGVLVLIAATLFGVQRFQVSRLARSVAEEADAAAKEGKFERAAQLFGEHLAVVPDDVDVKIKYADALIKGSPSLKQQTAALSLYGEVLRQYPGAKTRGGGRWS